LKALSHDYRHVVQFVDIVVRQGHPGPGVPVYRRLEQKRRDAARFVRDESIPWLVAIDDLEGSVHAAYGLLPDPTDLIGTDGRVAFYSYWTHVPTLRTAVAALLRRGGAAVLGEQRLPHPAAPLCAGWPAIARGLPQSGGDLDRAAPGSTAMLRVGEAVGAVAGPAMLTSRPWSRPLLAAVGGALLLASGVWRWSTTAGSGPSRSPRPLR
jgi:hypothetical protein